jgi:hypothetical protein
MVEYVVIRVYKNRSDRNKASSPCHTITPLVRCTGEGNSISGEIMIDVLLVHRLVLQQNESESSGYTALAQILHSQHRSDTGTYRL